MTKQELKKKKNNKDFKKFMQSRHQSIRNLEKEVEELKKTVDKVELDIDVKIANYEKFPTKRQYNKFIVGMLKQLKKIL
ncbi:MAG TPA: hypothetical protein VMZ91_13635 [Candidatus Paceibacterota bacterium]|nr:hypothetical protein [Candidatus Paceibacterota bacterium]